ncbi:hypothetical protein C8J57DRAFT_1535334 [Mycena rebaudengoi]|nr:hypothetical protein C8J57DRAFT_1535334 [Mycena rebaudengoi]
MGLYTHPVIEGDFTVQNLNAFDPSNITDCNGLKQTNLFLLKTKSGPHGEHVHFAKQNGPEAALANQFRANSIVFSIASATLGSKVLIWIHFIHSLCIGSIVEYLLWGVPLDIMKAKAK